MSGQLSHYLINWTFAKKLGDKTSHCFLKKLTGFSLLIEKSYNSGRESDRSVKLSGYIGDPKDYYEKEFQLSMSFLVGVMNFSFYASFHWENQKTVRKFRRKSRRPKSF